MLSFPKAYFIVNTIKNVIFMLHYCHLRSLFWLPSQITNNKLNESLFNKPFCNKKATKFERGSKTRKTSFWTSFNFCLFLITKTSCWTLFCPNVGPGSSRELPEASGSSMELPEAPWSSLCCFHQSCVIVSCYVYCFVLFFIV